MIQATTVTVTVGGDEITFDLPETMAGHRGAFQEVNGWQVHVDSYQHGVHKPWHEVVISNGSIHDGKGYREADYSVLFTDGNWTGETNAKFYDGTAYVEFFGVPSANLQPQAAWYFRHLQGLKNKGKLIEFADIMRAGSPKDLLGEWDAEWWRFAPGDKHEKPEQLWNVAISTHMTGSPNVMGYISTEAAAASVLWFSAITQEEREPAKKWLRWVYMKAYQACRRPVHFYETDGEVWRHGDYPNLRMGEYGPVSTYGGSVFWGRDEWTADQKKKGPWNGWDEEHAEVDTYAALYVLTGSRYALRQMRHTAEAVLSCRTAQEATEPPGGARSWAWCLKTLCVAAKVDPDSMRSSAYENAARDMRYDFLLPNIHLVGSGRPRVSFFSDNVLANGKHIYPTVAELKEYFGYMGWDWLWGNEPYDTDWKDVSGYVIQTYGSTAYNTMLSTWGWQACFHVGAMAAAMMTFREAFGQRGLLSGDDDENIRHVVGYLLTEASNPSGTFWYDTAVWLPDKNAGSGQDVSGVVMWVAGGLGWLISAISDPKTRNVMRQKVKTVTDKNEKDSQPGTGSTNSYTSWFLPFDVEVGL